MRNRRLLRLAEPLALIGLGAGIVGTVALRLSTMLHADVAHFLALSKITSDSRQLYDDVIDQNTPGMVGLGRVSIVLSDAVGVPLDQTLVMVVTLIVGAAFLLAWRVFRKLTARDPILSTAFGLCGALVLFALPGILFGSREHLFFACFLPYVTSVIANGAGLKRSIPESLAIGLIAAFGVFLKPHFLVFPVVSAAYEWWRAGFRLTRLSRETWVLGLTVLAAYVVFLVLEPGFFRTVIPYTLATFKHYQIGFWPAIGQQLPVLGSVAGMLAAATVLAYWASEEQLRRLLPLGWLFWGAGVVVVGVQGFGFEYHVMPLRLMGYLGGTLLCVWGASLFLIRNTALPPRFPRPSTLMLILVGAMSIAMGLSVAKALYRQRLIRWRYEIVTHPFVRLLNDNGPGQYVYIFCSSVAPGGLAHVYSDTRWAGHMIPMFFLPIIADHQRDPASYPNVDAAALAEVERSERQWIARDLRERRPRLVLIDVGHRKRYFKSEDFDYLAFLNQDVAFAAVWRELNYGPAGIVEDFHGRPFAIYRRATTD